MLTGLTLPALLHARANEHPDDVILEEVDGPSMSARGFEVRTREWMATYSKLGVVAGSRVLVMLATSVEAMASWMALARLGAVEVGVHTAYRGESLAHVLRDGDAQLMVTQSRWLDRFVDLDANLPGTILVADEVAPPAKFSGAEVVGVEAFQRAEESIADRWPDMHDVCAILYTSGTTGASKGVLVTWEQLRATAAGILPLDELGKDPAYYCPFPTFHVSGKAPLYTMALVRGRLVIRESFKTDRFWDDVDTYRCTTTNLMNTMAQFLFSQPPSPADSDHSLRNVLMVPLIPEVDAFMERFDVRVCTVFNMTETSCPIGTEGWRLESRTGAGRVRPGYEARIVDSADREVPNGDVGELVIRSDAPWRLMSGYWQRDDATVEAYRNQWFHTGDLFRRATTGEYFFVDRLKDAIRRRGENISSIELESYVLAHPDVAECAAVAVPSPWGEDDVKVVVVPVPGVTLDPFVVYEFLKYAVPAFMVPRYIQIETALPRTATNKIRKAVLRSNDTGGPITDFELSRVSKR